MAEAVGKRVLSARARTGASAPSALRAGDRGPPRAATGPPRAGRCRLDCRIAIYPGVHAADAAREIEQALAELPGVQSARVNLSTKRVAVESWT